MSVEKKVNCDIVKSEFSFNGCKFIFKAKGFSVVIEWFYLLMKVWFSWFHN
jgi:hypothetical protein